MHRNEKDMVKAILEWKPTGKGPNGWSRKRYLDMVKEDFKKIKVGEWRTIVDNTEEWRRIVTVAKTLKE